MTYKENYCLFQLEQWYTQLSFFAHVLAFANSSINPMIYAGFNDNFKKGKILKKNDFLLLSGKYS